ncbi:NUDIX hydrolase [Olivibacter sitiensis]|uniref:NUDIX hydrolase n=1 Tax=Olivibacter sitiensis TaxID=376470 RepID=UPI000419D64A|nr:NUDIX hydrolase [Olivibacter sitiensis]
MSIYSGAPHFLVAVDNIIFGFDGEKLKILLVHRHIEPEKGKWSLMGGFIGQNERPDTAALRVVRELTGISDIYMEHFEVFGEPQRDPIERTISIAYFTLIDINKYQHQINHAYSAAWFPLADAPQLIFDHDEMVKSALQKLRYKAALHPVLFELLPEKFTIPQITILYEEVYGIQLDKRNFARKLLSLELLIKLNEKEKESSKKGAFYYRLNEKNYKEKFGAMTKFIPFPYV